MFRIAISKQFERLFSSVLVSYCGGPGSIHSQDMSVSGPWSSLLILVTQTVNSRTCKCLMSIFRVQELASVSLQILGLIPLSRIRYFLRCAALLHIRDPVLFLPLDLGSRMGNKSGSGSGIRIRDPDPGQPRWFFRELRNHFFWLKYVNSFLRIRD
jgi:hypothetical protein